MDTISRSSMDDSLSTGTNMESRLSKQQVTHLQEAMVKLYNDLSPEENKKIETSMKYHTK